MLYAFLFLIIGFVLLIKGADFLVEGASAVAKQFGISDIIIGLTIVSMGTSAPELVVSIGSAWSGDTGLVFGNVIGSNIANTCLIVGVAGLIYPLAVQRNTTFIELPISLGIVVLVFVLSNDMLLWGGKDLLGRVDGIILLIFFAGFLYYIFRNSKQGPDTDEVIKAMPGWKAAVFIAAGIAGLIFGGNWVVESAKTIAMEFGMSKRLVGLTIVAIGTSLPELATSAIAAYKKNSDIAMGNVVGSNVFNILLVLGTSATIMPTSYDVAINWDLFFLMAATIVLFAFLFIGTRQKGKRFILDRWQAGFLLVAIMGYYIYLISTSV